MMLQNHAQRKDIFKVQDRLENSNVQYYGYLYKTKLSTFTLKDY